jgi:hypothetical protein
MKRLAAVAVLGLSVTAVPCTGCSGQYPPKGRNEPASTGPGLEWQRDQDQDVSHLPKWTGGKLLPSSDLFTVLPDAEAKAIAVLDVRPFVELTGEDFRAYTGKPAPPPPPSRAYLVRAISDKPDGTLNQVWYDGGVLTSVYGTDLSGSPSVIKRPLVVIVPAEVKRVRLVVVIAQ